MAPLLPICHASLHAGWFTGMRQTVWRDTLRRAGALGAMGCPARPSCTHPGSISTRWALSACQHGTCACQQESECAHPPISRISASCMRAWSRLHIVAFCGQGVCASMQMRNMVVGDRRGCVEAVADMALTACCRRKALLAYFGERSGRCQAPEEELCDFCRNPKAVVNP